MSNIVQMLWTIEGTWEEPEVIMGDIIKKTPEVIDLLESDDQESANLGATPDKERKKRKGELMKRLHRKRKIPCK